MPRFVSIFRIRGKLPHFEFARKAKLSTVKERQVAMSQLPIRHDPVDSISSPQEGALLAIISSKRGFPISKVNRPSDKLDLMGISLKNSRMWSFQWQLLSYLHFSGK